MSINDLKQGRSGFIHTVGGNPKLAKRLMALGYTKGAKVTIKASAPLGDPVIVTLRGFDLALRRKDAANIEVKEA